FLTQNRFTMKSRFLPLLYLIGISLFIISPSQSQNNFECQVEADAYVVPTLSCPFYGLEDEDYLDLSLVTIKVRFHFLPDANGNNFHCDPNGNQLLDATYLVDKFMYWANSYLSDPRENEFGTPGKVVDTRIRLEVDDEQSNSCEPGIYIYSNGSSPDVSDKTILHFIFRDHANVDGDFPIGGDAGNPAFVNNLLKKYYYETSNIDFPTKWARVMVHELAHNLNLPHSFDCANTCYDMDNTLDCHGPSCPWEGPPSPGGCNSPSWTNMDCKDCSWGYGNNLMGYNGKQSALTPCQVETMWTSLMAGGFSHIHRTTPAQYLNFCANVEPDKIIESGTSITWSTPKFLNRNVIVENNATLTITCEVRMGTDKSITVEPGGNLVINGGKVTHLCGEETLWKGIIVQGVNGLIGSGRVSLSNDSEILFAENGITSIDGGIVFAKNSYFTNNQRGIKFLPCTGTSLFYVLGCEFEVNDDLKDDFNNHISASMIRNLTILQSNFLDSRNLPDDGGEGILTVDTDFRVSGGLFKGLEDGIESSGVANQYSFAITGATFQGNEAGIRVNGVNDIRVSGNSFDIGAVNLKTSPEKAHGVILIKSTRYNVFENDLLHINAYCR
ncbi:MAG: hypothetical protein R2784_18750, partial [Saprospiraceae bacterium]